MILIGCWCTAQVLHSNGMQQGVCPAVNRDGIDRSDLSEVLSRGAPAEVERLDHRNHGGGRPLRWHATRGAPAVVRG
eukprot:COSAG02_NODE_3108_length_7351_cov_11.684225_6_plen_77_part_00